MLFYNINITNLGKLCASINVSMTFKNPLQDGLKFVGDFLPPINNFRRKLSSVEEPERNVRYFSESMVTD